MAKKTSANTNILMYMVAVLAVAGCSYVGWTWLDGLTVHRVTVDGARHAYESDVLAVARVDTGVRLLDVEPAVIVDRTKRHPWVRAADVRRLPPGTVHIAIEERTPVALAVSPSGLLEAYLDGAGYSMPIVDGAIYDVPLIRGVRLPANETQPIATPTVLDLLRALDEVDPTIDALFASFALDPAGGILLYTAPAGSHASIGVRLGQNDFDSKFKRLHAFWSQAVLSRPEMSFEIIDLRFDSQIVTRES